MKKSTFKFLSLFLVISILISMLNISVIASEADDSINKVYCDATLEDGFTDNEILIVLTPDNNFREYTVNDFSNIECIEIEDLTIEPKEGKLCRILHLTLSVHSKQNVLNSIKALEERDDIYSAEPNYLGTIGSIPNDPAYINNDQWAIDKIELPVAWDIETGSDSVKVGIIDSGIDASHPDLIDRVNTALSRSFVDHYSSATSGIVDTHGTHVAGIIGAQGNDGGGMTGVCWDIELISLRVDNLPDEENKVTVNISATIEAIKYADEIGIDILNLSGGWYGYTADVITTRTQIENFDGLFVCSAGNKGYNTDNIKHYPSDYNLSNVISVGASTSSDLKAGFSNYGKTTIDIFAPGENVLSTIHNNDYYYAYGSGTSQAAPFVAGVAALLLSAHPELTAAELKTIIMNSVDIVYDSEGNNVFGDLCVSGGRLNARKALMTDSIHVYSYTYEDNSSEHSCICTICGYEKQARHTYICTSINSREHSARCVYCSFEYVESHVFNLVTGICKICKYDSNGMIQINKKPQIPEYLYN